MCAEIPDESKHPELHRIVTLFMIHGPCGTSNLSSPCMADGKCSKKFPKEFVKETCNASDGYPHYQHCDNGCFVQKKGVHVDNRYAVPYNSYVSKNMKIHINVQICSSLQSCKYLYKYVYKGLDMASVSTTAGKVMDLVI